MSTLVQVTGIFSRALDTFASIPALVVDGMQWLYGHWQIEACVVLAAAAITASIYLNVRAWRRRNGA